MARSSADDTHAPYHAHYLLKECPSRMSPATQVRWSYQYNFKWGAGPQFVTTVPSRSFQKDIDAFLVTSWMATTQNFFYVLLFNPSPHQLDDLYTTASPLARRYRCCVKSRRDKNLVL